jgi:hypothetical protein
MGGVATFAAMTLLRGVRRRPLPRLADSVGLALLVVLEKLEPAERLAVVLHDVFRMSFKEIVPLVDRSVVAGFEELVAILDPDIVLRPDAGAKGMSRLVHGLRRSRGKPSHSRRWRCRTRWSW